MLADTKHALAGARPNDLAGSEMHGTTWRWIVATRTVGVQMLLTVQRRPRVRRSTSHQDGRYARDLHTHGICRKEQSSKMPHTSHASSCCQGLAVHSTPTLLLLFILSQRTNSGYWHTFALCQQSGSVWSGHPRCQYSCNCSGARHHPGHSASSCNVRNRVGTNCD